MPFKKEMPSSLPISRHLWRKISPRMLTEPPQVFPRTNTAACDAVKSRMVSFCNANDTFCDSGNSLEVHLSYVQDNGTAAVDFVVQKAKGAAAAPAGGASPAGKSNVTTTSAAASDLHWSSKALTGAFGVMSLALAFILAA